MSDRAFRDPLRPDVRFAPITTKELQRGRDGPEGDFSTTANDDQQGD
jgi:hypothetical protein